MWSWCSCLGCRDFSSTRYSGKLVARAAGNIALEGYGNQYWSIHCSILAWRNPLTEKPGRPQSTGSQRVGHNQSDPVCLDERHFFACGSFAPVRVELEGGTPAWLVGTLAVPSMQGHGLCCSSYGPFRVFFRAFCSWRSEGLFAQSFSVPLPGSGTVGGLPYLESFSFVWHFIIYRGAPLGGVLLCRLACQALKGAPWLRSYSVVQCIRWVSLSIVQLLILACGEREAMVMAPPSVCDSAVSPCFHCCLTFFHRHFPPQYPSSYPLNLSLCSQQQPLPRDCSTIPKLQLPAAEPSREAANLSGVCMAAPMTV